VIWKDRFLLIWYGDGMKKMDSLNKIIKMMIGIIIMKKIQNKIKIN
jgi:hypothetical protein